MRERFRRAESSRRKPLQSTTSAPRIDVKPGRRRTKPHFASSSRAADTIAEIMAEFTSRTLVRCPLGQAARRLSQYFRANGNADGDVVRLELGFDVTRLMHADARLRPNRNVVATVTPIQHAGNVDPEYHITWADAGGGPYPVFVGRLSVEPDEDYRTFFLRLTGDYVAPFGLAGALFDAVLGRRLAKTTIATLLLHIAGDIEHQFDTDERSKRRPASAAVIAPPAPLN
jgi:hypothetical protein